VGAAEELRCVQLSLFQFANREHAEVSSTPLLFPAPAVIEQLHPVRASCFCSSVPGRSCAS
jgi:hypothetical protein